MLSQQTKEKNERIKKLTGKCENLELKGRELKKERDKLGQAFDEKTKEILINEEELKVARKEAEESMHD